MLEITELKDPIPKNVLHMPLQVTSVVGDATKCKQCPGRGATASQLFLVDTGSLWKHGPARGLLNP